MKKFLIKQRVTAYLHILSFFAANYREKLEEEIVRHAFLKSIEIIRKVYIIFTKKIP